MTREAVSWVLALAIPYAVFAVGWWGLASASARDALREARYQDRRQLSGRDHYLEKAHHLADLSRRAPYWPVWIAVLIARTVRESQAEVRQIREQKTDMDAQQRKDRLAAMEHEVERLRREQEGELEVPEESRTRHRTDRFRRPAALRFGRRP